MKNLQDIKTAVSGLSSDELVELRAFIDQQTATLPPHQQPAAERIRQLDAAADQIREALTADDWAQIDAAMNADDIEPLDDDGLPQL